MSTLHLELANEMMVQAQGGDCGYFIHFDLSEARKEPPYDELDPGIQGVVKWLFELGFNPVDSGDGNSKGSECMLDYPHVFMTVDPPENLAAEVERLSNLLEFAGVKLFSGPATADEAEELGVDWVQPDPDVVFGYITGSYSPGGPAVIELAGVDWAVFG